MTRLYNNTHATLYLYHNTFISILQQFFQKNFKKARSLTKIMRKKHRDSHSDRPGYISYSISSW